MNADAVSAFAEPVSTIPTGTVTLLFSDIEGSTVRWEAHGEAMAAALRRHDELMTAAITASGGYVFKTIGDAFCAAFSRAGDAVRATLAAQRAIVAGDWSAIGGLRVRMALHTGITEERDRDYFGPTVNRVARLLSIVHGGQVVLSESSAALVRDALPAGSELRDVGVHKLKDLATPERAYQLLSPDFPLVDTALKSPESRPHNLPAQVSSFVGRESEIAEIRDLLRQDRMVTLLGHGGVGKTRISLEVGNAELPAFDDGVWFIELANVLEPELLANSVAAVLSVPASPNTSMTDSLVEALRSKSLLLILDNCEHVVAAAARFTEKLLRGCPAVKVLASSREALAIAGETVYPLRTLTVPDGGRTYTAAEAAQFGAVALFCERARAYDRKFALTDDNVAIVIDVCRQLDGIALAIELAVARLRVLSLKQLAEKLKNRFHLLVGGSRTASPRQQTLRSLIDWSYDLLTENERAVFRRVAYFMGGFTLEAASTVCADDRLEGWEVLDILTALVDKSLVVADFAADEPRYRLLETTRAYGLEKLEECQERQTIARAHADYHARIALEADATLGERAHDAWLMPLRPELGNFRLTLEWTLRERGDAVLGARVAGSLSMVLDSLSLWSEAVYWCELALGTLVPGESPECEARVRLALAFAYQFLGRQKQLDEAQRAVAIYRELGERARLCEALTFNAQALQQFGRDEEADALATEALALARTLGSRRLIARTVQQKASTISPEAVVERRALLTESLALARAEDDDRQIAASLINLGEATFLGGDVRAALDAAREGLVASTKLEVKTFVAISHANIAAYALALDDFVTAAAAAREALVCSRATNFDIITTIALEHFALIAALRGDTERAGKLLGFCEVRRERNDQARDHTESLCYDRLMRILRGPGNEPALPLWLAAGAAFSDEAAILAALDVAGALEPPAAEPPLRAGAIA